MSKLICPECGAEAFYQDEHPDGYYKANLGCSKCDWFEQNTDKVEEPNLEDLPF